VNNRLPGAAWDASIWVADSDALYAEFKAKAVKIALEEWPIHVSSALARVEVMRIAARVEDRAVEHGIVVWAPR
jgi:hypothetical protein